MIWTSAARLGRRISRGTLTTSWGGVEARGIWEGEGAATQKTTVPQDPAPAVRMGMCFPSVMAETFEAISHSSVAAAAVSCDQGGA
jgi:hypothetical protein